jgi:hypothetical protein
VDSLYFKLELEAIQRFCKKAAALDSVVITANPEPLARPIIVWEAPWRGKPKLITSYKYSIPVKQYGKLQVNNGNETVVVQEKLILGLEDLDGMLDILDANGVKVGRIQYAFWTFDTTDTTEVPFNLAYEVTYCRPLPVIPGPAINVGTDIYEEDNHLHVGYVHTEEGG